MGLQLAAAKQASKTTRTSKAGTKGKNAMTAAATRAAVPASKSGTSRFCTGRNRILPQ
jgi:hypothetical protein